MAASKNPNEDHQQVARAVTIRTFGSVFPSWYENSGSLSVPWLCVSSNTGDHDRPILSYAAGESAAGNEEISSEDKDCRKYRLKLSKWSSQTYRRRHHHEKRERFWFTWVIVLATRDVGVLGVVVLGGTPERKMPPPLVMRNTNDPHIG